MNARRTVPPLALSLLLCLPMGAAAQTVLMQAKTSGGAEVATIRTDSMRLLVPLRLVGTGLSAGFLAADDSLRVGGEGSFLATGTFQGGVSVPPASGAGTRMMWYPEKAAFRAGLVDGTQWDAGAVGGGSAAFGESTTASGTVSLAGGAFTTASGQYSVAFGAGSVASGDYSFADGDGSTASGANSIAFGSNAVASAMYAKALGNNTTANGSFSTALGDYTTAQTTMSLVIGRYNVIAGDPTYWVSTDPLFVAGNGTATTPSNALTLYKDGNMTIAGTLTQSSDARLKEDMEPLEGTLAKVLQLTPIRYRFRPGTGRPGGEQIGLTAQQVQPLFPELVKQDADGYLSLSYANLSAVLVKAVQEQQAEIAQVRQRQAQVAPLKAQIRTLQQRNDQVESRLRATQSEVAALKASQAKILRRLQALDAGGGR